VKKQSEGGSRKASRLVAAGSDLTAIRFNYKFYLRAQTQGLRRN